jgi:hypothetical protein
MAVSCIDGKGADICWAKQQGPSIYSTDKHTFTKM